MANNYDKLNRNTRNRINAQSDYYTRPRPNSQRSSQYDRPQRSATNAQNSYARKQAPRGSSRRTSTSQTKSRTKNNVQNSRAASSTNNRGYARRAPQHSGQGAGRSSNRRNTASAQYQRQASTQRINDNLWTPNSSHVNNRTSNNKHGGSSVISYLPLIIAAIVLIFIAVNVFNFVTYPNIYNGVHVGEVDVSGMTKEDAAHAISYKYNSRIENANVIIFAGEDGKYAYETQGNGNESTAEQISVEEANSSTNHWDVKSTTVGAHADSSALAEKAYEIGRENGGLLSRIGSMIFGTHLDMEVTYDNSALETLAKKIDATMGYELKDWDIAVVNGVAETVPGYDGYMVNRSTLSSELTKAFIAGESNTSEIIAHVELTPVRINESDANSAAQLVNNRINKGLTCSYESQSWSYSPSEIGEWITTEVIQDGTSYKLVPSVNAKLFSDYFYTEHKNTANYNGLVVNFEVKDGNVSVITNGDGTIPLISQAVIDINNQLFLENSAISETPSIEISSGPIPELLSFQDAVDQYVITAVSSYTTEFSTISGTEARNSNIRLGAQYITNTVCHVNGGTWSFNSFVGDTTQEKGYQAAGSISEGEYVDTYGGGICQVATTVFNAIFDSCYKINERHPHSLYISSYPAGRDAAISWDDLDLIWQNDTTSDVLLVATTNEDSITVTLYSVPQSFSVKSEVGDWEEGEKYKITVKEDENLAKGTQYVKTTGADGSKITVNRYVYDQNGSVTYTNTFTSKYEPKNEVIVCGPGTEVDTTRKDS